MELTLSSEEARALRDLLVSALAELRSEIHHTDSLDFRERLHQQERLLVQVRDRLGANEG